MAQQTYRQLINKAIQESGVSLGEIGTGSSFTTPADTMHKRYKTWVADAWKEIQLEFSEMEFTQKLATIMVNPRVYVEAVAGGNTPSVADYLQADDTDTNYGVATKIDGSTADIHLLSGTWGANTAKAYIGLDMFASASTTSQFYKLNEMIDLYDSDNTTLIQNNAMRVKGVGRYDLATEVSDLLDARYDTFYLQTMGGHLTTARNDSSVDQHKLELIPYERWMYTHTPTARGIGQPSCFTQTPQGHIEFDSIPDQPYILHFFYEGEPQVLSTETETLSPAMKEQYEDIIVWKAVMHYADYDRKPEVFVRARKRYDFYLSRLMKKEMPEVNFNTGMFRR